MAKEKRPARFALLLFAIAWFLPVEATAARIQDGILPGYQAFVLATALAVERRVSAEVAHSVG